MKRQLAIGPVGWRPALDLVEPRSARRCVVKSHLGMALQPSVVLLMGVEIVEDDLDLPAGIISDNFVHEGKELLAAPALLVRTLDFAARHLEGSKQRRGAIALIVVAMPRQGAPIGQFEIALCALERLDRGLLIDTKNDGIRRGRQIETDNIGCFCRKLRIVALAPTLAPTQIDFLLAQRAPDVLDVHITQRLGDQRPVPARKTLRRRLVEAA